MPTGTVVTRGYLAPRIVDGVRGRVRATFDHCAYVAVDGGPALVLHASGRDHTPTSLCPASWPPPASAVAVGDAVVGRAGHLKVGALVLDVRGAREWRPGAAPRRLDAGSLRCPAPSPGQRRVASVSAPAAVDLDHRLALREADLRTCGQVPVLERALARRDGDRVAGCVASLVGRGPGLTPSGDDALVGLLAVLHRLAPAGDASRAMLCPAVAAVAHRTGDISAHYLRLAIVGHLGERLVALCDALACGARDEIDAAAAAVVATGATSGAYALLGVLSGVRLVAATLARDRPVAA